MVVGTFDSSPGRSKQAQRTKETNMDNDNFACAIDGDALQLSANDNADGRHIIVNIDYADGSNGLGIALTADQAYALADLLNTLAAGVE